MLKRKYKGGTSLLTLFITLILAMVMLPAFASGLSTLFAGTDALDRATQARQYALIEADILKNISYANLADKPKAAIPDSDGFHKEVIVGPETEIGDGSKQKISTINIYKDDENFTSYILKVPHSTAAEPRTGLNYEMLDNSGVYTVPDGVTRLKVTAIGGGGGGQSFGYVLGGRGGYGGGIATVLIEVEPGQQIDYIIGVGGASSMYGNPGGNTSFGSYIAIGRELLGYNGILLQYSAGGVAGSGVNDDPGQVFTAGMSAGGGGTVSMAFVYGMPGESGSSSWLEARGTPITPGLQAATHYGAGGGSRSAGRQGVIIVEY